MTLERLIELALTSDYLDIYTDNNEYTQLHLFENTWHDLLNVELEGLDIKLISEVKEPDYNEMLVICDNCGHAIHVKRMDAIGGEKI